jgi:uncharacterized protein YfaS (alpha-2-macroglobulin family)
MSARNIGMLSIVGFLLLVGGGVFFYGKMGAVGADINSPDCKFYGFTDRKAYNSSQQMSIGVKNDKYSKCTLKIRTDNYPWSVIDSRGKEVYKFEVNTNISSLKPGDMTNWQWDMRDLNGRYLSSGSYKIKFNSLNKTAEFTVN